MVFSFGANFIPFLFIYLNENCVCIFMFNNFNREAATNFSEGIDPSKNAAQDLEPVKT